MNTTHNVVDATFAHQTVKELLDTPSEEHPLLVIEVHRSGEATMHGRFSGVVGYLRELQAQLGQWIEAVEKGPGAMVWTGSIPSVVAGAKQVKEIQP